MCPKQVQLCTASSFGAETVCYTFVQYQTVPDTVTGSNRHSHSKINENLTKRHLHIAIAFVLSAEAIFLEFLTQSQVQCGSGQGKLSFSTKLKDQLWMFVVEDEGQGQTHHWSSSAQHHSH